MTEEEREIRDLKEMKEKHKEEYYRKRKNGKLLHILMIFSFFIYPRKNLRKAKISFCAPSDLLDNLLEPSVPASHATNRSRQQSQPFGPLAQTTTVPSSSSGTDQNELSDSGMDGQANESDANDQNGEDELLVDVDVDAMMIGDLDELDYYDQRAMTDEKLDADDIPDDGIRVSGEGRYRAEPLSLLLRALALEGLEW